MSEIVDRVAKAIDVASQPPGQKDYKILMENAARAAIEAMREPTQAMRLAGVAEWSRPDPTGDHESTKVFDAIWRAMIDAALRS